MARTRTRSRPTWLTNDQTIYHVLVIGDDNAIGQQSASVVSPVLSAVNPGLRSFMFSQGPRCGIDCASANVTTAIVKNLATFLPIQEMFDIAPWGETISTSMAKHLEQLTGGTFLFSVSGYKDRLYADMSKGTQPYNNSITHIRQASRICAKLGRPYKVLCIVINAAHDGAGSITVNQSNFDTWQSNYTADITAITGQVGTIPILTYQEDDYPPLSTNAVYGPVPQLTMSNSLLTWHNTNPAVKVLVGARHKFHTPSGIAMSPSSQRWQGYECARVCNEMFFKKSGYWLPLKPLKATLNIDGSSPTVIAVDFVGCTPPLVIDYATVLQNTSPACQTTGALGTVVTVANAVTSVPVNTPGSYMPSGVTVSFSGGGGSGATASVVLSGTIAGIIVDNGGSGYTSAPTCTVTPGTNGATGTAPVVTITNGVVTGITIATNWTGNTTTPTLAFSGGGGGTGASAHVLMNNSIASITVNSGGSGYGSAPTATLNYPTQVGGFTFIDDAIGSVYVTGIAVAAGITGKQDRLNVTLSGAPAGSVASQVLRAGYGMISTGIEGNWGSVTCLGRINLRDSDPYVYPNDYPGYKYCVDFQVAVVAPG